MKQYIRMQYDWEDAGAGTSSPPPKQERPSDLMDLAKLMEEHPEDNIHPDVMNAIIECLHTRIEYILDTDEFMLDYVELPWYVRLFRGKKLIMEQLRKNYTEYPF